MLASSHSPEFLSKSNIPENSLCNYLRIRTPEYVPKLVPHGYTIGTQGVTVLHTPGHTPDSLALYDPTSTPRMLYVGDTLYESAPIIFPNEGSIMDWFKSIEGLIGFVKTREEESFPFDRGSEVERILFTLGTEFTQCILL